jgi:predicted transporter
MADAICCRYGELMSSDLIAWVVGITLGIAVVGLGLRRNLGDLTRSWLPRFGEGSEPATATPGLFDGGQGRRELSPRQRQFVFWAYLLISVSNAAHAILSADGRLLHAISAVLWLGAGVFVLKRFPAS